LKINYSNKKIFPEDFFAQQSNQATTASLEPGRKFNNLKINLCQKNNFDNHEAKNNTIDTHTHTDTDTASPVHKKIRKVQSFREVLKIEAIPEEDEEKMKTVTTNFLRQSKGKNFHKNQNFEKNKNIQISESRIIFDKFNNYNLDYESKIISSFSNLNDESEGIDYFDELEKFNFTPTPNRDKSSESNIMNNEASTSGSYRAPMKQKIFNFENLENLEVLNHLNIPAVDDHFKQTACFSPLPSVRKENNIKEKFVNDNSPIIKEINISDNNINDISEITPIPHKIKLNICTSTMSINTGNNIQDKNNLNKTKKISSGNVANSQCTTNSPITADNFVPLLHKANSSSRFKLNRQPSINKLNSTNNGNNHNHNNNHNNIVSPSNHASNVKLTKTPSTGKLKITYNDKKFSNSPSSNLSKNIVSTGNCHSSKNMLTSRISTPKNDITPHRKSNFCNSNKNVNNFNKKFSNFHADTSTGNSNSNLSVPSTNASPINSQNHQILPSIAGILPPLTSRGEPKKIQFELKNIFSAAQNFKEDPEVKGKIDDLMKNIFDIQNVLQEKSKIRAGLTSAPTAPSAPTERKILNEISRKGVKGVEKNESKNSIRIGTSSGSKTNRNSLK
jgi:hypothetical protein